MPKSLNKNSVKTLKLQKEKIPVTLSDRQKLGSKKKDDSGKTAPKLPSIEKGKKSM